MKKLLGGILVAAGGILVLFGAGAFSLGLVGTGEVGLTFIMATGAFGMGLLMAIAGDVLMEMTNDKYN